MPTLAELLATSDALSDKVGQARNPAEAASILEKKALIDFAAFGEYKKAEFVPALTKALGWGVGLSAPALAAGLIAENKARKDAKKMVDYVRNQAALAALAVPAAKLVGDLGGRIVTSADTALYKLAAAVLLDEMLSLAYDNATGDVKVAAKACLMQNREHGVALLKRLV